MNILAKKALFITFYCCFCSSIVLAQLEYTLAKTYAFKEGLSDPIIRSITQDEQGLLWLGTGYGINRFDGKNFLSFNNLSDKKYTISGAHLQNIVPLANHQLALIYKGQQQFIDLFDPTTFVATKILLHQSNGLLGEVQSIYAYQKETICVLTTVDEKLVLWRLNKQQKFSKIISITPTHFSPNDSYKIAKTTAGNFLISSAEQGLFVFNKQGQLLNKFAPRLQPGLTNFLHYDQQGRLWLAFENTPGIWMQSTANDAFKLVENLPPDEIYVDLWEDKKGNIITAIKQGVSIVRALYLITPQGKITNANQLLEVDNKLITIWGNDFTKWFYMGTHTGLYQIRMHNKKVERHIYKSDLLPGKWGASMRGFASDEKGNVYVAREVNTWYKIDANSRQLDTLQLYDPTLRKVLFLTCSGELYFEAPHYLWGVTCQRNKPGFLLRYNLENKAVEKIPIPSGISALNRDQDGLFWLAHGDVELEGTCKLFTYNRHTKVLEQWLDKKGKNPLENTTPFYLHIAKDNTLWVGTHNGLFHVFPKQKEFKKYSVAEKTAAFSNDHIITIQERPDQKLLLGTNGGGLMIFDPETEEVQVFDEDNCGLKNSKIAGILPDEKGNYFLSTFDGLAYLDIKNSSTGHFYEADGLNHFEFNRRSSFKDKEGRFYFGGVNGVSVFRPEDLLRPEQYPAPVLTAFRTYTREKGDIEKITNLQPNKSLYIPAQAIYYEFEWTLPAYEQPENSQYYVKLEGFDEDWKFMGNQNTITYNQLKSGNYKLLIRGGDARNNWDNPVLEVPIIIEKLWYEKWSFQFLFLTGIVGLIWGFSQWRTNLVVRKSKERNKINKKFAELELQALQAQLNPHFIFNSLGAIQYFLQDNKIGAADQFLGKFAKLMRMFLESSKNKYISLREELDLIELYVEMEQLRFEGKFAVSIEVDENIDLYSTEIPSVLLQPFVENAINHGLFHKETFGHLLIKFTEKTPNIEVIIEDNGIGRAEAQRIREHSLGNHKSRAMQIVNERIEVLSHVDDYDIKIETIDLYNDDKTAEGTRVTIVIPELD